MRLNNGSRARKGSFARSGRIAAALIAAAVFAACAGGEGPVAADGRAISFAAKETKAESRANITTGLRKIGMFGYSHTGSFNDDITDRTPDFFLNQPVTDLGDNGIWTYNGVRKYWPMDGREVSFFAYAPFIDVENTFKLFPASTADKGAPKITYTVPAGILDQIDLLYGNRTGMTYDMSDNGQVELTMQHALTRVDFIVRLDEDEKNRPFVVKFNELTVRNVVGGGTLDLSKGLSDPYLWTTVRPDDDTGWANYTLTPAGHGGLADLTLDARVADPDTQTGQTDPWNWNRLLKQDQYLMLVPQGLEDTEDDLTPAEISLKYTFTNVYTGEVREIEEVIPLWRAMLPAWKAGEGVTYQLTVSLVSGTVIEFEVAEFIAPTPWVKVNEDNPITGKVD